MESDERRPGSGSAADMESEWDRRRLCSDGNCIGVIGLDGRCKECGKPDAGDEDLAPVPAAESGGPFGAEAAAEDPSESETAAGAPPEESADAWADRRLCSDGNCIGVIGADGRCKECGKPWAG